MGMYGANPRPVVICGRSRTKQGFKNQCNINVMVEKYRKTGLFSNVSGKPAVYLDVSEVKDYHEAMNTVVRAREAFEALDPKIRARFSNDPGALVSFLSDEANRDEAVRLGLVKPSPAKQDGSAGASSPAVVSQPDPGAVKPS